MTEIIVEFFRKIIENDTLTIIIIAMLPIVELRGAIPIAFGMEMSPLIAFLTAYFGSSLVVPVLLLLLRPILDALKKIKFFNKIAVALESVFKSKADKVISKAEAKGRKVNGELEVKYKVLGVLAFVAVPLPMTGVWTGSAVAAFLDLKFPVALLAVLLGNLCAGIIMTLLCVFLIDYLDIILTIFLTLVVALLVIYVVTLIVKSKKTSKTDSKI
jgi:uncharacterized membrane protein